MLRQVPTCPDVPVVVVTAYADHDFRIEALNPAPAIPAFPGGPT